VRAAAEAFRAADARCCRHHCRAQSRQAGRLDLDAPIARYLSDSKAPYASRITSRMLMQHVSGLPRTEEGPIGRDDWSTFDMVDLDSPETGRTWCEGPSVREPLSGFLCGDCDFIMKGAVIEATSGKPYATLLRDCGDTPVRIVERRGFVGGVVLRNIIQPDLDMVIIMTSNRAEAEAAFGEIWQQAGITQNVMRAALCATGTPRYAKLSPCRCATGRVDATSA